MICAVLLCAAAFAAVAEPLTPTLNLNITMAAHTDVEVESSKACDPKYGTYCYCCGQTCFHNNDCSAGLYCARYGRVAECRDPSTDSTVGPACKVALQHDTHNRCKHAELSSSSAVAAAAFAAAAEPVAHTDVEDKLALALESDSFESLMASRSCAPYCKCCGKRCSKDGDCANGLYCYRPSRDVAECRDSSKRVRSRDCDAALRSRECSKSVYHPGSKTAGSAAHALPVLSEPLPSVSHGWNTSVGSADERKAASEFFRVSVADDESLWLNNIMTPFIGKTMRMTAIEITKRNPFNTIIELAVNTGEVLWTINVGPPGVMGPWTEHINGGYTGVANIAGFVSPSVWIENDSKHLALSGLDIKNDWGMVEALSASDTTIVMKYSSYKKSKFIMTWTLKPDSVVI